MMDRSVILCLIFKVFKLQRIVIIAVLVLCFIMTLQMLCHKASPNNLDNSMESMSSEMIAVNGKKNVKDLPGFFMSGVLPAENGTFCRYNYGLPKKLNWDEVTVTGSPQLGKKSPYRVIYNAIERTMHDKSYAMGQVTYATHVTPEFLYHIVEIARFWDGPISVTAFVPDYDLDITMKLFTQLCRCFDGMAKVSLHFMYPENDIPRFLVHENSRHTNNKFKREIEIEINKTSIFDVSFNRTNSFNNGTYNSTTGQERTPRTRVGTPRNNAVLSYGTANSTIRSKSPKFDSKLFLEMQKRKRENYLNIRFKDCSIPDMGETRTFRSRHGMIYPVNVARNVARNASNTQYNLVSDVEMIPSEGLATRFTVMMKRHKINGHYGVIPKWRLAFVIPVFEVEAGEDVPRNKSSLQQLYAEGKAVYFHRWVCGHCQRIPDLQAWLKEDPGKVVKPFAITKRQYPYHRWEPIFIATKHTPWYSETLSWEGRQDKMTQMLEMCLKSYDFVVVNGAFLCHSPGIKTKSKRRSWRYRHELVNTKQYDLIVKGLAERYPSNPKCRLE